MSDNTPSLLAHSPDNAARFCNLLEYLALTLLDITAENFAEQLALSLARIGEFEQALRVYAVVIRTGQPYIYGWRANGSFAQATLANERLLWIMAQLEPDTVFSQASNELSSSQAATFEMQPDEQLSAVPFMDADKFSGALVVIQDASSEATSGELTRIAPLLARALLRVQRDFNQQQQLWMLRTVIDTIPGLVYVKDTESRFLLGNTALLAQLGQPTEAAIIGKSDAHFHPEGDAYKFRTDELVVMSSGSALIQNEEQALDAATGEMGWYLATKTPLVDQHGHIIGLIGYGHNITARKKAEAALAQQERLMRVLIDHLPGTIFVKDTDSRILLANRVMLEQLNVEDEADILGKTDFELHTPEMAAKYFADERAILDEGKARMNYEEQVFDRSLGEMRWLSSNKIPLRDEDGNLTGLVGINYDITERKQLEMNMLEANEMLELRVSERTSELSNAHEQLQREMQERQQQQAENERLQQQVIEAQRDAIEAQQQAILELSTPIIPVTDGVIIMPIVGAVDTHRATDITRAMLAGITTHRARVVILDITGVSIVDTGVANYLNKTMQAARLKGARTIVTGISDAVAETVVDLGIEWHTFETLGDLQSGLRTALAHTGYVITKQR